MLLTNTNPGNRKIGPGSKGLIKTSRKCSRLFPVSYPNFAEMSWNSVQPLSLNVANRHGLPWKHGKRNPVPKGLSMKLQIFLECSMYHAQHILKISWKSVHAFIRNVVGIQTISEHQLHTVLCKRSMNNGALLCKPCAICRPASNMVITRVQKDRDISWFKIAHN